VSLLLLHYPLNNKYFFLCNLIFPKLQTLSLMTTNPNTKGLAPKLENQVHKDIIHGETIRKEMRYADKNIMKHFQLNPHNVYILPEKPNYINPTKRQNELLKGQLSGGYTEDPVEEAFSNEKIQKTLRSKELVPRQKAFVPMTASQEIGWFNTTMQRPKSAKDHKLKSNPITKFASDYYDLTKINPFTIR